MAKTIKKILRDYKKRYGKVGKNSFDIIIKQVRDEIQIYSNNKEVYQIELYKKSKLQKKRWYNLLIKKIEEDKLEEFKYLKKLYKIVQTGELKQEDYEKICGYKSFEDYKANQINKINIWYDRDELLTTCPLLTEIRNIRSVNTAFIKDIMITYLESFSDQTIEDVLPLFISKIQIDPSNKAPLFDETKEIDEVFEKMIWIDDEIKEKLEIKLKTESYIRMQSSKKRNIGDILTQLAVLNSIKNFNTFDIKIILYFYSKYQYIALDKKISKYDYEIAEEMGLAKRKHTYDSIVDSVSKIGSVLISYSIKENSVSGVFFETDIAKEGDSRKITVYLGNLLKELVMSYEIGKERFNNLSNDAQAILMHIAERRYRFLSKNTDEDQDIIFISELMSYIAWNTKRLDRRIKRIKDVIMELDNKKILIESHNYNKKTKGFKIEYTPLTISEINKLKESNELNKKIFLE